MKQGSVSFRILSLALSFILIFSLTANICGCTCVKPITSHLVINEVMFDPFGEDAGNEWVEIYNAGPDAQGIKGWTLSNRTGETLVTLPDWTLPALAYLVVYFGSGTDDEDFSDGAGSFYTSGNMEVLDNDKDEVALYYGSPKSKHICDFISWSSTGAYEPRQAHDYAVDAGIWDSGDYFDIGFPSGKSVLGGYSIGRDKSSSDTNQPKDWDNNGGGDTYYATPEAANTGPLFSTHAGIKLTQTKANLFLIDRGYALTNASHEIITESQTDDATYVKAVHHFTGNHSGVEKTLSGIGEYHWYKVSPSQWNDDITLMLTTADEAESYSLNYSRKYNESGLVQTISENTSCVYTSYTELDEDTPIEDPPYPEAFSIYEESYSDQIITTLTQTALRSYSSEVSSTTNDRGEQQNISFTKNYSFLSDTEVNASTELTIASNMRDDLEAITQYTMLIDDSWYNTGMIGAVNASYDEYILTVGNETFNLNEPGYYRIDKVSDTRYNIEWSIVVANDETIDLGGSGHLDILLIDEDNAIYKGIISPNFNPAITQFCIDGWITTVAAGVCALGGGLLGGAIGSVVPVVGTGAGATIGGALGAIACGLLGDAIESATEKDTTPPVVTAKAGESSSDKNSGRLTVTITITDDEQLAKIDVEVKGESGNSLGTRHYKPNRKDKTLEYTLVNHACEAKWFTINLDATDSSGNEQAGSHSYTFLVPGGSCVPNVKKTEPENKSTGVSRKTDTKVTYCKPMDTSSMTGAISIDPPFDYDISWSENNTVMTLTPEEDLDYGTTYTITISTEAKSSLGHSLAEPYSFSFTTEEEGAPPTPPGVIGTIPLDGEINVTLDTSIYIEFSQSMNETSVEAALSVSPALAFDINWSAGSTVVELYPVPGLEYGITYNITIGTGAESSAGYSLPEPYTFSFTAEEEEAAVPPKVMATGPPDGATGVPLDMPISIEFNQPMNEASVEAAILLSPGLAYEVAWFAESTVVELYPIPSWEYGTLYTVTIGTEAESLAGLHLPEPFSFSFTTMTPE